MPELVWYRSLYWRIGLGFIACVAGLLIAQAVLFVWLTNPSQGTLPGGSPQRFATLVASDISTALDADPSLDIAKYVQENFDHVTRPIVVFLRDGRIISTRRYSRRRRSSAPRASVWSGACFEGARDGERGGGPGGRDGESGGRGVRLWRLPR